MIEPAQGDHLSDSWSYAVSADTPGLEVVIGHRQRAVLRTTVCHVFDQNAVDQAATVI